MSRVKIYTLHPINILPIEAPHKPHTVARLQEIYQDPKQRNQISAILPPVFVHNVRGEGLHLVDGHHRTGVAHLEGETVEAMVLNTFTDLYDAYELADLKIIPPFDIKFPIEEKIPHFSRELPEARKRYALSRGIKTFDDFAAWIKEGKYYNPWQGQALKMSLK